MCERRERYFFDNFVTTFEDPDIPLNNPDDELRETATQRQNNVEDDNNDPILPTVDAGSLAYEVEDEIPKVGVHVSGHNSLNGIGTLLTRREHAVQGSSIAKNMFQKIVSTTIGHPVSLIYPTSTLFPSIYYRSSTDGSVIGCLPATLYTEKIGSYGFQYIPLHTRSMLTSSGFATSTDPRFIAYSYDVLTN